MKTTPTIHLAGHNINVYVQAAQFEQFARQIFASLIFPGSGEPSAKEASWIPVNEGGREKERGEGEAAGGGGRVTVQGV